MADVNAVSVTGTGSRGAYKRRQKQTFAGDLLQNLRTANQNRSKITWPNERADHDPEWFFYYILGVELTDAQLDFVRSLTGTVRSACKSGHKVGKSKVVVGAGLSKYCAYYDSRVVFTSTTNNQVNAILWRELKMTIAQAGRCVDCKRDDPHGPRPCPHSALIDGNIELLARTGLKSGFREIVGYTAKEPEAIAGISGAHLWYFVDEASGVPNSIFEAIEGNRAGGAGICMTSNPTKTEGTFFEAFTTKSSGWDLFTISSESTPNCTIGPGTVPGLADPRWIEEKKEEWGEDSPFYKVRVKGEFPLNEDGKIFSIALITESQANWFDEPVPSRHEHQLHIGVDPAGATGTGDDTAVTVRRGNKVLEMIYKKGLTEEGHLILILSLANKWKEPGEKWVLVLDRDGKVGANIHGTISSYLAKHEGEFWYTPVRSSDAAKRKPRVYDRWRDELASNLEDWMRRGGTILTDRMLEQELHCLEWFTAINGKMKVTSKLDIKKLIHRSPDRYDSLALSCWESISTTEDVKPKPNSDIPAIEQGGSLDPYAALDVWSM